MRWTAIIPYNHGAECKTRLAQWLNTGERRDLSLAMARHVAEVVSGHPKIEQCLIIAPADPVLPGCQWVADHGRGLNAELQAVLDAQRSCGIVIFHADLPCIATADIDALIDASTASGIALAPDWRNEGTNAIAARKPDDVRLHFGRNSFALHRRAMPDAAIVHSGGVALDLDTYDDVKRLQAGGVPSELEQWLSPARYGAAPV